MCEKLKAEAKFGCEKNDEKGKNKANKLEKTKKKTRGGSVKDKWFVVLKLIEK